MAEVAHQLRPHLDRATVLRLNSVTSDNLEDIFPASHSFDAISLQEIDLQGTPLTTQVLQLLGPSTTHFTLETFPHHLHTMDPSIGIETNMRHLSALFRRAPCLQDVCLRLSRVQLELGPCYPEAAIECEVASSARQVYSRATASGG